MSKPRAKWGENVYRRRLKEGRGHGEGESYIPWILIHDLASKGYATRIYGDTTHRIHHLLSHMELYYFCLLDWSGQVLDIREQFPMRLTETLEIALKAGIRHPWDNRSNFPYVMTTDFLITTVHGMIARTIKSTDELSDRRVREKFEIERRYWESCGIPWKIVTEKQINIRKAKNILWLKSGTDACRELQDKGCMQACEEEFLKLYRDPDKPFHMILENIELMAGAEPGTGLALYKQLVRDGKISLELSQPLNLADPRRQR